MYRNAANKIGQTANSRIIQRSTRIRTRNSSTYTLDQSSTAGSSSRSKTLRYAGAGALAVVGGGTAWLLSSERDTSPVSLLTPPSFNSSDPLSALDPSALSRTTAHLTGQALTDLCRQWLVFAISEQSALVQAGPWLLGKIEWTRDHVPIVGTAVWAVFAFGMNQTFYKVFVGGETVPGCQETVDKYAQKGVGVMFNYSAEAPLGASKPSSGIDHNCMREIQSAVIEAGKLSSPTVGTSATTSATSTAAPPPTGIKPSLLAIKLTGLIYDASLLTRASNALKSNSSYQRGSTPDTKYSLSDDEVGSGFVFPQSPELSDDDHVQLGALYEGLRKVARDARKHGVRLLVDAEQSWFQPAIDHYADLLSQEFNKPDAQCSVPIVYNTYQCYLRTTPSKLETALQHATTNNYSFGAKLVRGAYVESERKRHHDELTSNSTTEEEFGPCVVWNSKEETDECYDACATLLEKRIVQDLLKGDGSNVVNQQKNHPGEDESPVKSQVGVCLASHNGTSMKKFLENLRRDGLVQTEAKAGSGGRLQVDDRLRGRVAFGQLMGMSDNLTATLLSLLPPPDSSTIPLVVKYVPYATLSQGLPYLIRRANENQSILKGDPTSGRGGAREERRAVGKEIRSRMGLSF